MSSRYVSQSLSYLHILKSMPVAKRQILQATPEERIAQLEVARAELVVKKNEMERKMGQIAARRRAKEEALKNEK